MNRGKFVLVTISTALLAVLAVLITGEAEYVSGNSPVIEDPSLCKTNCSQPYDIEHGSQWMKKKSEGPLFTVYKPNVSGWADSRGVPPFKVRTNGKGLREDPFPTEKPANTTRILVIGDSFTYGLGVNRSERFTDIVETRLDGELPQQNIQVINAGVSGYGMKDYYLFLKHRGVEYEPDIVVISFIGSDWYSNENISATLRKAKKDVDDEYGSRLGEAERNEKVKERLYELHDRYLEQGDMEDSSFGYMNDIKQLAKSRGIEPVYYAIGKIGRDKPREFVDSWAERHNGTVFYAPDEFRQNHGEEVRLSEWDKHPNPRGHQIIAEGLYPVLERKLSDRE